MKTACMLHRVSRQAVGAAVTATALAVATVSAAQSIGPSTTTAPYVLPSVPGVGTTSILTVGDTINGYEMVGIPDGLGAFKGKGRSFTLLMNHELGPESGAVRAHGSTGAFVSRWQIDRKTLEVKSGQDQTPSPLHVHTWVGGQYVQGTTAFNRLCSADLPARTAFSHRGEGTKERIFLNGEETRPPFSPDHGRAFAHIATGPEAGQTYELPRLGKMAFENVLASPHSQKKTVVMLMDDAAASTSPVEPNVPSELYIYVGTKTKHGNAIERAGLTNGKLFGVKVVVGGAPVAEESDANGLGGPAGPYVGAGTFTLHDFGNVENTTGVQLQTDSIANGITRFQRVEDGAWDPRHGRENDFYFVTTASITTNSRLWRVRFTDVDRPELGGTLQILLKGDEGHRMLDNMTMDRRGRVIMQEDVGNNPRLGKIWVYNVDTAELVEIAAHDPARFTAGAAGFLTADEESSGVIDASKILGRGWFLLDVQAHFPIPGELVEGGQLLAMYVDPSIAASPAANEDDDGDDEDDD